MEYPRLMYRSPSVHTLVNNDAEYDAALADGWFPSVPEAKAQKVLHPRRDMAVTVYKEGVTGPEKFKAKDQAEADAAMLGDGWYSTEADAHAAYVKALWPKAEDVPVILADLARQPKEAVAEYAARIGAAYPKNAGAPAILEAIKSRLEAGPGK